MSDSPIPVPQNAPPPPAPLRLLPRDASDAQVRAASATLSESFKDDPIAHLISSGVPGLHEARMYRTVKTGVLDLEVYTVSEGDDVLGVMVVKPPGFPHRPNSEGPQGREADDLAKQKPGADEHYAELKKVISKLEVEAFGPSEVTDMFYISHIGVAPSAQGRGVGAGFCNYMVARGRATGIPVSLLTVTEGLARYYKKFGFKTRAFTQAEVGGQVTKWWVMSTDP
ncbi:hypothetical protein CspeluHIS016_0407690 [Cutaneotrichosporon spelunceum]|uniref:N-acetyltransferase domain-containing protein n=1 Tax=Cutaneotrichosporon spelunceum TaxID=1672016 RepID=A0AAD3YCB4_9TREE|nr:hypothetical protein CspeluHIS016_0407690 [Cutaneotrichosporon spelunceum]